MTHGPGGVCGGVHRQNSELPLNQALEATVPNAWFRCKNGAMPRLLTLLGTLAVGLVRSRRDLLVENIARGISLQL